LQPKPFTNPLTGITNFRSKASTIWNAHLQFQVRFTSNSYTYRDLICLHNYVFNSLDLFNSTARNSKFKYISNFKYCDLAHILLPPITITMSGKKAFLSFTLKFSIMAQSTLGKFRVWERGGPHAVRPKQATYEMSCSNMNYLYGKAWF